MDDRQCARPMASLVAQHYQLLYRYAYRLTGSAADAEDLTQQAFLIAQEKLPQLREIACAKSWLCTILRNAYLKRLRDEPKLQSLEFSPEPCEESAEPEEIDIDASQLQAALGELPEDFRSPLILFYFEEFSYKEIAEQMQVPIGTIMSRLARAKAHLRRRLLAGHLREPVGVPANGSALRGNGVGRRD